MFSDLTLIFFFFDRGLWHARSKFPDQGLNLCPLLWQCGVLATRLPGKSLISF